MLKSLSIQNVIIGNKFVKTAVLLLNLQGATMLITVIIVDVLLHVTPVMDLLLMGILWVNGKIFMFDYC